MEESLASRDKIFQRRRSMSRSFTCRGSISSKELSTSHLTDDNTHEVYSGTASEAIPLSISSFHYPIRFSNRGRMLSTGSRETSTLLPRENFIWTTASRGSMSGASPRSEASSSSYEIQSHFKFFSLDEIESAKGGSTLENADDPVDYNTNWDYTLDKYETLNDIELDTRGKNSPTGLDHISECGLVDYEPRSRRLSHESNISDNLVTESDELNDELDEQFYREYPCSLKYQRYYLAEEDLVIGIAGYTNCWYKTFCYRLLCCCTFGLGYLILRWSPKIRVSMMGNSCCLGKANWCVVENNLGELEIVNVSKTKLGRRLSSFMLPSDKGDSGQEDQSRKTSDPVVPNMHTFVYRYIKFYFDPCQDWFRTNSNWYDQAWLSLPNTYEGVSQLTYELRLCIFGKNKITLDEKSTMQLLVQEVLHPFYVFQVFSVLLWLADDYFYYATCIFVISLVSIVNSLVETKTTILRLHEISKFSCEVRVWRNGFWKQVDSEDLVPGEFFEVDLSMNIVPCDSLLLNGECVLSESMLTGESVPVSKISATQDTTSLLPESLMIPTLARSLLYSGTKILKIKSCNDQPVTAIVLKTGFHTTKGSLIRSILFPKPTGFKFYRDSFKYVGFMTLVAVIGFLYSIYNFIKLGLPLRLIALRSLDIITIVVPPALPATLTIGTTFAINRLKKMQVFCTSPTKVNVGGKIDIMCFDKTGTLTEEGLDVLGVHLVTNAKGRRQVVFKDIQSNLSTSGSSKTLHDMNNEKYLLGCMSCCHSLRLIEGELWGDPLDQKMFAFTTWSYHENPNSSIVTLNGFSYQMSREFEFVSALRRMSVVAISETGESYIFTKGAPEVMIDCCEQMYLPVDFDDLLHKYTHSGYRVIACGYKKLSTRQAQNIDRIQREEVELHLFFTGFIIFENKLKKSTKKTMQTLNNTRIRSVMCTGDNILTAISVGRECELLDPCRQVYIPRFDCDQDKTLGSNNRLIWEELNDHSKTLNPMTLQSRDIEYNPDSYRLAITGDVFRYLLTEYNQKETTNIIMTRCDIFARMSPDEKHELVEQLQKIDYTVGFCGDGANDCGALKAADVGISLSEAESSVAAPLTSRNFSISCVLDVLREGRSSLVTSFSCFKYMSLYSAIQFITITILYKQGTNLGDFQFLYIDMCLILPLAIFMLWSKPSLILVFKLPTANLVSPKVLIPLLCHIIVLGTFQSALWLIGQRQSWSVRPIPGGDNSVLSTDNTVLFLFSNMQYIFVAIVLSKGPPYREPLRGNVSFLVNTLFAFTASLLLFKVEADSTLGRLMQLTNLSRSFYILIALASIINYAIMACGEEIYFIKFAAIYKSLINRRSNALRSKKLYKNLCVECSMPLGA